MSRGDLTVTPLYRCGGFNPPRVVTYGLVLLVTGDRVTVTDDLVVKGDLMVNHHLIVSGDLTVNYRKLPPRLLGGKSMVYGKILRYIGAGGLTPHGW